GIYNIKLPGMSAFKAPCSGSGWLVIQRRMDGSVNFNRSWTEYRYGFGKLTGEFFIGLEKLHRITRSDQYELLISLGKVDGSRDFVKYDDFRIGTEQNSYPLESFGNHTGGAGDSLKYHEYMKFTTYDRDNDLWNENCVKLCGGGWWFNQCATRYIFKRYVHFFYLKNVYIHFQFYSSLNGRFYKDGKRMDNTYGILWKSWHNNDWSVSLTFVEMMIRPKPF
ncbi:hypothetical protein KR026_003102, partial [Drosophila bipectinata]